MKKIIIIICAVGIGIIGMLFLNRPDKAIASISINPAYKDITATVIGKGRVQSAEEYTIVAKSEGRILTVPVKECDWVNAGRSLIQMDNGIAFQKILEASQNIKLRQIEVSKTKDLVEAKEILVQTQSISQSELQEAEIQYQLAQTQLDIAYVQEKSARLIFENSNVAAPINGVIASLFIKPGDMVSPGTPLMLIINPYQLKVEIRVNEFDSARVKVGQNAQITIPTQGNIKIDAHVTQIQPILEKIGESYTSKVTLLLPSDLHSVKPGNQVDVRIITGEVKHALTLPLNAVSFDNGQYSIALSDGTHLIDVGLQDATYIEIKKGLSACDKVVLP